MAPGQHNVRAGRLRDLFRKVVVGQQMLTSFQNAKLFIEAICDQPNPVKCAERLISSPKGLPALNLALRIDLSWMMRFSRQGR